MRATGVLNAAKHHVPLIARPGLDVALRSEFFAALALHGKLNVRPASGIRYGFDDAELVFIARPVEESGKTLKISIALAGIAAAAMEVKAVMVRLPDIYEGVPDWFAARVRNATVEPADLATDQRKRIIDYNKIIVRIERRF